MTLRTRIAVLSLAVLSLAVHSGTEDCDDGKEVVCELVFLGSVRARIETQQPDSTVRHDELNEFVAEAGESVFVCHDNLLDISRHALFQKGLEGRAPPIDAAGDVLHDVVVWVPGAHVGNLSLQVVSLST